MHIQKPEAMLSSISGSCVVESPKSLEMSDWLLAQAQGQRVSVDQHRDAAKLLHVILGREQQRQRAAEADVEVTHPNLDPQNHVAD